MKFKIQDIKFTVGRIIASGSNNYYDPWKFDNIPAELMQKFNQPILEIFLKVKRYDTRT